jgi:glucoamylase
VARTRGERAAFGGPGIEPRWTHGGKDGVGTAYSATSRIWFTLWNGVLTEVYYPTIDRPQVRDLQFLVTDGESFFHDEKRDLLTETHRNTDHALAYGITNSDPAGRYRIVKEVLAAPHLPCVLQRVRLEGDPAFLERLRLYALCAPHLHVGGAGNNACVLVAAGREILCAEKDGTWLALGASLPFSRASCGYVGASDGWTDLAHDLRMDWEFDLARNGNVALTGEILPGGPREFTLALAFGDGRHSAVTTLLQALGEPFAAHSRRYAEQWSRPAAKLLPLKKVCCDLGDLFHSSYSLLLAHEDKSFPGAFIASLSIPWGESKGDEDMGGYHLVWTRDLVNTATALLAAGNNAAPLRALVYLAATQREDGGFSQNFWINGEPYWGGVQLDEVAFPILLAWKLDRDGALAEFDPYHMVLRAARFLIRHGPATQQERWEEASGYSPSTLAAVIAALICAAGFTRERGDEASAVYLEEYADFLECHIEPWTVTTAGTLHPDIARHYIRIRPVRIDDPHPDEDPNRGLLVLANQQTGRQYAWPAREIVDAGFLELVRYGVRAPDDPDILRSLEVVDAALKVDTPFGPCWRRYNHDGYGQRDDGRAYQGWGRGRAWPLLTGERGHFVLAAGGDVEPYTRTLENLASRTGLLPEQVWDEPDRPELYLRLGGPTGAAMPLAWAHAEYVKLIRSAHDGVVFDLIPAVADRYLKRERLPRRLEIWKPGRQPRTVVRGFTLRVQAPEPFLLHWSVNDWNAAQDSRSTPTALGIEFVDLPVTLSQSAPIRFTFRWLETGRWEGRDYEVAPVDG